MEGPFKVYIIIWQIRLWRYLHSLGKIGGNEVLSCFHSKGIKKIVAEVKQHDDKIWIRPEISGKKSQFGDLDEVLRLSQEIELVMPCIDFSHLYARTVGENNTGEEFKTILGTIERCLGKKALENMHIHVAGIAFGEKGEKNHLLLKESKFNYADLLKVLKEFKVRGVLVCESPNIEEDAMMMQKMYSGF